MNKDRYISEQSFSLHDFTGLDDHDFLQAAYAAILKRDPDQAGYDHYLQQLTSRNMTRVQVLGRLRYSSEGRRRGIRIKYIVPLLVRDNLFSLPVLGRVLSIPVRGCRIIQVGFVRLQNAFAARVAEQLATRHRRTLQGALEGDVFPQKVYLALENELRSAAGEMETAFKSYLPYLLQALQKDSLVVDLGCGRGEWLSFLQDHAVRAVGVDHSQSMLELCREQGLDVVQADIFDYLSGLENDSVCVLTGFQLIEHLQPADMVRLWQECFRVLRPGGLVLFETPNPENFQVSAYYFYLDPTHKKPVPPPLAAYTMDALGFRNIRIVRNREFDRPIFEDPRLNQFFCAAMDYAVLAWKPEEG